MSLTFIFEEEQEQLVFLDESLSLEITYEPIPSKQGQFVNNAILKAKKIAGQKPNASFTEKDTNRFMSELDHMSKSEILVKLMSYLVEKQEKS